MDSVESNIYTYICVFKRNAYEKQMFEQQATNEKMSDILLLLSLMSGPVGARAGAEMAVMVNLVLNKTCPQD